MPKHIIKKAARLDMLKRVLSGDAVAGLPARTTKARFSAKDFPIISQALGKSDMFTNTDVLKALDDVKFTNLADQRQSMMSSELSDLLAAAKADAGALKNVKADMGRIMADDGLHFDEIGKSLYGHAGKDVDRVITKRRLQRALAEAESIAQESNRPRFGDIAIGSGLGIGAGLGGTAYLHSRKNRIDQEKRSADYSKAFLDKCKQLGYDPKALFKEAQQEELYDTLLTAATEGYSMDDVRDAIDVSNKQIYDFPKLKGTDLHTPGASPSLMEKLRNKEKLQNLIATVKKLVAVG